MNNPSYPSMFSFCKRLVSYLKPYKWIVFLTVLCMAVHSVFSIGRTVLAKYLLDDVLLTEKNSYFQQYGYTSGEILVTLSVAAAVVAVFMGVTKFAHLYLETYLNSRVIVDLQKELFDHILHLSMRFHNQRKMGDLISRLTNDMQSVDGALKSLYSEFFLQPFMLLASILACLYYSWQLSLITFLVFPAVIIPLVQFGKQIYRRARKRQVSIAEVTQEMQQVFSGIRVVKSFHAEEFQQKEFSKKNESYFKRAMSVHQTKAVAKSFVEFLNNLGVSAIIGVGGYLILSGGISLTPGDLMAFMGATGMMYAPIKDLSRAYNALQDSIASGSRIFEILEEKPEIADSPESRELSKIEKTIAFDNVTFGYEASSPVLRNVSFSVHLGEIVAIVGPSGAGKSTMLDLLLRFYDPQEGSIRVDGNDIRQFTRSSLLEKMAVVNQDPYLFHKSIGENIAFGKEGSSQEEIISAAKAANIHDFITTLPQGYQTIVGDRGVMLSGGQRQRLTIARAILKRFSILLLDEATSSLDTESEKLVQEALEKLMEGHTTFVVAHRLSTIKNANKIILMEAGKMIDMGTHEELMERVPLYRRLYEIQSLSSNHENPS